MPIPPKLIPIKYDDVNKHLIETGKYLIVRKDGKTHLETFNGSGWAYNDKVIEYFYVPKIN